MSLTKYASNQLDVIMEPLAPWRRDPAIDEIAINKPGEAWVRQRGKFERYDAPLDFDDLYDIAILAGALNQQNVSERQPLLAADLPSGERLQVVLPPCVPQGSASLTFRIHGTDVVPIAKATERYNLQRWNQWLKRKESRRAEYAHLMAYYDAGDVIGFLRESVRLKFNPILAGATGSGKSTLLKTLIAEIAENERLLTIENALELQIVNQPNHVRLLYSHGDQGVANVSQTQLIEASLRMRPDRIIIGELRDPEAAWSYLMEAMTGHPGSPCTVHGKDASQAATRLFNLVKGSNAGRNLSDDMVLQQLGMVVDVIVPLREHEGTYEIGEVWFSADAERRGTSIKELME